MPKTLITFNLDKLLVTVFFAQVFLSIKPALSADFKSEGMQLITESLTEQKDVIWGFDFLDANKIIFTQRSGELRVLNLTDKKIETLKGVPEVWARGQGGLLDVRVHPKNNQKIFFTYSEPVKGGEATTALAVADLDKGAIKNIKKILSAAPSNNNEIHFGSRIEFDDQDHLFMSIGDRNDRPSVQNKNTYLGKTLRLNLDGSIPKDNPFFNTADAKKEIWSLGHRSPQGLAWDKDSKQLWQAEMGPKGGDEVNLIKKRRKLWLAFSDFWPRVSWSKNWRRH